MKHILTILLLLVSLNAYSQQTIRFAYIAERGTNPFILDDAVRGGYEIIIDEYDSFSGKPEDYLMNYVKSYLDKNPSNVRKSNENRFMIVANDDTEIGALSSFGFNKPVYVLSSSGVHSGAVEGYYLNCCDDFMAGLFYPVLGVNDFKHLKSEDYKHNLLLVTSGGTPSKLRFDEETDMSKRFGVFKSLDELYKVSITKGEDTQEEIAIFPGSFTTTGAKQYIASYRDHPDFTNYVSGIVVLDEDFKRVTEPLPMTKPMFDYTKVIGTVDVNGDGIDEVIIETGYYEGAGYQLWQYKEGKFEVIASGFYFGV